MSEIVSSKQAPARADSDKPRTANVLWLQGQTDAGCSMSMMNVQQPDLYGAMNEFDFDFGYMNTINPTSGPEVLDKLEKFEQGDLPLDVLIVEGSVPTGPDGTGMACLIGSKSVMEWVEMLAPKAEFVVAAGTCAAFGNIPAAGPNPTDATGLQFHRRERGGLLGEEFRSNAGLPVVNISGCPVHPDWVIQSLGALLSGEDLSLDEYNRPKTFFDDITVHQGCPRNEHYEYKEAAEEFGDQGCLYLDMGCEGPNTHAPCNRDKWNRQKSLTQVGIPCHGCNQPDFPEAQMPFFERRDGLTPHSGLKALAYSLGAGFMKAAKPERLTEESGGD